MDRILGTNDVFGRGSPLLLFPVLRDPPGFTANEREPERINAFVGVGACVAAFMLLLAAGNVRPLDATVQMERLADKVQHARVITPDTAAEIGRITARPWYDCAKVACAAQLAARNREARSRLGAVMAAKTRVNLAATATTE